jgi:hypothetical protein
MLLGRLLALDCLSPNFWMLELPLLGWFMPDVLSGRSLPPDLHMPAHVLLTSEKMLVLFPPRKLVHRDGADLAVGQESDSLGTKALDGQAAVIESVAVAHDAAAPDILRAFLSQEVAPEIVFPKIV